MTDPDKADSRPTKNRRMTHWLTSPSFRRWREIALYALIAASVISLARPQLLEIVKHWVRPQPPQTQVAIGFLAAAVLIGMGRRRWAGCLRIVRWRRYAPHILAVPLGLGMLWAADDCCSKLDGFVIVDVTPDSSDPWHSLRAGTFFLCLSCSFVWAWANRLRARPGIALQPPPGHLRADAAAPADLQQLLDWIASDDPVADVRLDGYGHGRVAARIARRLLNDPKASVILVGPVGSGKSTIGEMTRQCLENTRPRNRTIRFQRISLWPFAFADSAIESILEQALECIRGDVDTLAMAGIPEAYTKAVGSQVPGIAGIVDVARHKGAPGELLDQINEVATTAGLEIVLWIEDLERFAKDRHTAVARQMDQVHSLIYELDSRSSIRVVVASATILERIDPAKIARYIEHVPKIEAPANWKWISLFREHCLSQSPRWIDSVTDEARSHVVTLRPELNELRLDNGPGRQHLGSRAALAVAVDTPRALKLGLRRALETWQVLRGEVDFDDVLAMSLVAAMSPRTFSFIDRHIDRLRKGPPKTFDQPNKIDETRDIEFRKGLENALSSIPDNRGRAAVRMLIESVFPKAAVGPNANSDRPQGFASAEPRDYWLRFTAQTPVDPAESDQSVLSAVDAWESGGDDRLLGLIDDETQCRATGIFGRRLSEHRVYDCLRSLCRRYSTEQDLQIDYISSRLSAIRSMLYGRNRRLSDLAAAAVNAMDAQERGDLRVAFSILRVFVSDQDNWYAGEHDHACRERIKQSARDSLIRACDVPEGEAPPSVLFIIKPWDLYRLVQASSLQTREPVRKTPFEAWPQVAASLVAASASDFARCMPYLLTFLTSSTNSPTPEGIELRYAVDPLVFDQLFDSNQIQALVTAHSETPAWPGDFQQRMAALRNHLVSRSK